MASDNEDDPLKPVTVSLKDLEAGTIPLATLARAFGPSSLGILLVTDLPPAYAALRSRLLSYSSYLANLPSETLGSLTRPDAKHLVGWSHGVEALSPGHYDTRKGSYYINCAFHASPALHASPAQSPDGARTYPDFPEYTAANVWPGEEVLPGFRAAAEGMCGLVIGAAELVARACDRFGAAEVEGYREGTLEGIVKGSLTTKARLLHYFPAGGEDAGGDGKGDGARNGHAGTDGNDDDDDDDDDDWCATHVDHGCLTGLTSAMYIDEANHAPKIPLNPRSDNDGNEPLDPLPELRSPPDPKTGLYIRSRQGVTTKVSIPRDCLAFQTGEALERITKGRFRAVPHFVRGASGDRAKGVARNTLAVFTQPNLWDMVDEENGLDMAAFAKAVVEKHT